MKRRAAKVPDRVVRARIRLKQAIALACMARGEALWTNGYRTGRGHVRSFNERVDDADHLRERESRQWANYEKAATRVEKLMAAYTRSLK